MAGRVLRCLLQPLVPLARLMSYLFSWPYLAVASKHSQALAQALLFLLLVILIPLRFYKVLLDRR